MQVAICVTNFDIFDINNYWTWLMWCIQDWCQLNSPTWLFDIVYLFEQQQTCMFTLYCYSSYNLFKLICTTSIFNVLSFTCSDIVLILFLLNLSVLFYEFFFWKHHSLFCWPSKLSQWINQILNSIRILIKNKYKYSSRLLCCRAWLISWNPSTKFLIAFVWLNLHD